MRINSESRRWKILAAVINAYIKTAMPVSSELISRDFNFSPATIRNVLSELEEGGYLMQPHTSAGRVPTDKGYRYYVDFLRSQIELLEEEKEQILKEIEKIEGHIRCLEDAFEKTSQIISNITHNTGIVSFTQDREHLFFTGLSFFVEQPEFRNIERLKLVLRILEEKYRLIEILNQDIQEKVKIYIGKELQWPEVNECSIIICKYNVKDKPLGRLAVLGPRRMDYERLIPTVEYLSDRVSEVLSQF